MENEKKYLIRENGKDYVEQAFYGLYKTVDDLIADITQRGKLIKQGYLPVITAMGLARQLNMEIDFEPEEARLRDIESKYFFTFKKGEGLSRHHKEIEISLEWFNKYWCLTEGSRIYKKRLKLPYDKYKVEFDMYIFWAKDWDLIVAEVETPTVEEAERLVPLGKDVTNEERCKAKYLVR